MTDTTSRKQAMIWGALVADAATMGTHWIYDQPRIRALAPSDPEFRTPDAADYEGVPSYFAHPTRNAGDLSQYGEQMLVMLDAITAAGGYNRHTYQSKFRETFGYGGSYVGYIDRPTRDTLDTIAAFEKQAIKDARAIDPSIDDQTHGAMVTKVSALLPKFSKDRLRAEIETAVRETHDDDALVAYAIKVAEAMQAANAHPGADDEQLPAVSKLPPMIAAGITDPEHIEDAVRVTNNNDTAVAYARFAADILTSTLETGNPPDWSALLQRADQNVSKAVTPVLSQTDTTEAVTAEIGLSCYLKFGLPSITHNLLTAPSYVDGIRRNIYAGGDNCGRAIILGAALGALHGVGGEKGIPTDWIDRLSVKETVSNMLDQLP